MIRILALLLALCCTMVRAEIETIKEYLPAHGTLSLHANNNDFRLSMYIGHGEPGDSNESQRITVKIGHHHGTYGELTISPYSITWGNGARLFTGALSYTRADLRIAWVEDGESSGFSVWQGEQLIGQNLPPTVLSDEPPQPFIDLSNHSDKSEYVCIQAEGLYALCRSSQIPIHDSFFILLIICGVALAAALVIILITRRWRFAFLPLSIAFLTALSAAWEWADSHELLTKDDKELDRSFYGGTATYASDDHSLLIFRILVKDILMPEAYYGIRRVGDSIYISLSTKAEGRAQTPVKILHDQQGKAFFELYIPFRKGEDVPCITVDGLSSITTHL